MLSIKYDRTMAAWPFDKWIFEYKSDGTEESFLSINKLYLAIKYQSVCVCACDRYGSAVYVALINSLAWN